MGFVIKELFAFIAIDKTGDEGVMGMKIQDGWIPMVGADMARIKSLKPYAQQIAETTGSLCKLKKFKLTEEIEF